MNIAIFVKRTTFHKGYGGLETQNKLLSEGFVSRGNNVVVFSPKEEFNDAFYEENGVKYVFINSVYRLGIFFQSIEDKLAIILEKLIPSIKTKGIFSKKGKEDWIQKSVLAFNDIHKKTPFDIVLCQSASGIGVIRNKANLGVKVISISHGTILSEYRTRIKSISSIKQFLSIGFTLNLIRDTAFVLKNYFTRQREFILHSNKVIAVSNYVKQAIIDETFSPEDHIKVIFNGVDPSRFKSATKRPIDERELNLIYVGRVIKSKGIFVLLDSLIQLNNQSIKLHVVGEGDDLENAKRYIKDTSFSDNIIFYGNVKPEEVSQRLAKSDVFVLPSIRVEGFPMVLVEAMFSGLPIITTNSGGNIDAVLDGKTGFIVPPNSIKDLADKIDIFVSDRNLITKMGKEAFDYAIKNFTLDVMLDKYMQVIRDVIK